MYTVVCYDLRDIDEPVEYQFNTLDEVRDFADKMLAYPLTDIEVLNVYAVNCYDEDGVHFGGTDYFDTLDDAQEFADEMAEHYLVDIVTPNGKVICAN